MNIRLVAALVVLVLIAGASAEYGLTTIGARSATKTTSGVTSTSSIASTSSLIVTSTNTQSPCSQAPFVDSPKLSASNNGNGTGTAETSYPVFTLAPGSQGDFCVTYTDNSGTPLTNLSYAAFDWNASKSQYTDEEQGIYYSPYSNEVSVTGSPANAIVQPHQTLTVLYTVNSSTASAGEYGLVAADDPFTGYGLSPNGDCGSFQLVVANDTSSSSFSEFPGLTADLTGLGNPFTTCPSPLTDGVLSGYSGMGVTYLENKTQFDIPFGETSRSIRSVVESPTEQNITVTLGIQTYALPVTVGQPVAQPGPNASNDYYYIANWRGNPELTPTPGDACDWTVRNATENGDNIGLVGPPPPEGVTVNAPTLKLPPYSDVTYIYSVEISNLTEGKGGYLSNPTPVKGGYFGTDLSVFVYWDGEVNGPDGFADLDVSQFLPVGQIGQSVDGTCTTPAMELINTPWYLSYVMPTGSPNPEPYATARVAWALPTLNRITLGFP